MVKKIVSEYEKMCLENARRNEEILKNLGIQQCAQSMQHRSSKTKKRVRTERYPAASVEASRVYHTRSLGKVEDIQDLPETFFDDDSMEQEQEGIKRLRVGDGEHIKLQANTEAIVVSGEYTGWVNTDLIEKYGIARSEEELAELNIPKSKPAGLSKNWSQAKKQSFTTLQSSPNTYFYRHCAPDCEKYNGEWTQEEHDLFLDVARRFGCGNQWGLFSSWIPHRVGYQCSNFYRNFILPNKEIIDPNFRVMNNGKIVYVPKKGARTK